MARTVIYVPMMHNPYENEILMNREIEEALARVSIEVRDRFLSEQKKYWDSIDRYFLKLNPNKVYLDNFCETVTVEDYTEWIELHKNNSRLWSAVSKLKEKGARIVPTELEALVLDYIKTDDPSKRDRYITNNIATNLQEGETAVLFMGLPHAVDQEIKREYPLINVTRPVQDISSLLYASREILLQAYPEQAEETRDLFARLIEGN